MEIVYTKAYRPDETQKPGYNVEIYDMVNGERQLISKGYLTTQLPENKYFDTIYEVEDIWQY